MNGFVKSSLPSSHRSTDTKKIDIKVKTARFREREKVCISERSASFFAAYEDLLCPVNRLLRESIVPAANTAAMQLNPVQPKSQIPRAIIPVHPALPQPLTDCTSVLAILYISDKGRSCWMKYCIYFSFVEPAIFELISAGQTAECCYKVFITLQSRARRKHRHPS